VTEVRRVAAEQLVGSLPAQHHAHALPGGSSEQAGGEDGGVGDRFRDAVRDQVEGFAQLPLRDLHRQVPGAQPFG
jgi:hypothetical protein